MYTCSARTRRPQASSCALRVYTYTLYKADGWTRRASLHACRPYTVCGPGPQRIRDRESERDLSTPRCMDRVNEARVAAQNACPASILIGRLCATGYTVRAHMHATVPACAPVFPSSFRGWQRLSEARKCYGAPRLPVIPSSPPVHPCQRAIYSSVAISTPASPQAGWCVFLNGLASLLLLLEEVVGWKWRGGAGCRCVVYRCRVCAIGLVLEWDPVR
jgi:hypothetical protein